MSLIKQFKGTEAHPAIQFVKYAIGGGLATATHITMFHLVAWKWFPALQPADWGVRLCHLQVAAISESQRCHNAMIANLLAFLVSNMVAYIVNILWVFKRGRHHVLIELGLFYLVSGVSIAIGTSIMGYLISHYGMQTTYAFISNLVTALVINFAMRKYVIFKG